MTDSGTDNQTTHVVFQGRHFVLPGQLSADDALIRVKNLTGGGPMMSRQSGPEMPLSAEQQGELDAADQARTTRLRGTGYSEGNADAQDWKTMGKGVAFAAAPSALAASMPAMGAVAEPYIGTALNALGKLSPVAKVGGKLALQGLTFEAGDQAMKAAGIPPVARYAILVGLGAAPAGKAAGQAFGRALRTGATEAVAGAAKAAAPAVEDAAAQGVAAASRRAAAMQAAEAARPPLVKLPLAAPVPATVRAAGQQVLGEGVAATQGAAPVVEAGRALAPFELSARQGAPASRSLILQQLRQLASMPGGKKLMEEQAARIFGDEAPQILQMVKASRSRL
jgi:hypothetical protein